MKKETLEETAKNNALVELEKYKPNKERFKLSCKNSFYKGAKWQEQNTENKYSEEDIRIAFNKGHEVGVYLSDYKTDEIFNEWFEKFKK